jgi:histone deacetylase complex regulatory component SIN3
MLNDRLISIPSGSEDDKNPLKKNHYEEHIFKFEDQRYEIDMIIEILEFAIEELSTLNERVLNENLESVELEKVLGSSTIRFISFFYKEYYSQVLQGIKTHPREAVPIVINRFKKRIDEATNQKTELDKNIKLSFDRFYYKSFDHRSFKLKNFEKKSNNAKAFIKELTTRKKEKLISQNLNILKGGSENFEFYYSINFKLSRELVNRTLTQSDDKILMKKIELNNLDNVSIRKKLPDMRIMIDNIEIFKVAISLIFYQIYFSNLNDSQKICESLSNIFESIFKINVNDLVNLLYNREISPVGNDKEINYSEIIESIKNKSVDSKILDKFYNIDNLSNNVNVISNLSSKLSNLDYLKNNILTQENLSRSGGLNSNLMTLNKDLNNNDNNSEISLTPSLQSQDTGKTYKDMVILEESKEHLKSIHSQTVIDEKSLIEAMFLPMKEKDHILFYANENWFVLIRFIFCVYERINKLYEYSLSVSNESNLYLNKKDQNSKENLNGLPGLEAATFKNFIVIYKALIHKKIESSSIYEELCRDILGNESYFLFNLDKLINSVRKLIINKIIFTIFPFHLAH